MNDCPKLRHWKHADAAWFRKMDAKCFPIDKPFTNGPAYHWWIADNERNWTIGFAGLYIDAQNVAHFCRAGIVPHGRHHGYHRNLIRARIKWCRRTGIKKIKTYARTDNYQSVSNLLECGFRGRKHSDGYTTFTLDIM